MFRKILEAEQNSDVEGSVTLKCLRDALTTPAWAPLADKKSTLAKVLLSNAFKNSKHGTGSDHIDSDYLRVFACLHCPGSNEIKARCLYEVLQGVGGLERHQRISATDKDLLPNFAKLLSFASADIITLAHERGKNIKAYYSADECKQM